jgi:pimeloyl-ACP methyl ester carboxylesterase
MSGPPVVLVHGFATSARRTWQEPGWIDLLTEAGRSVIAPDLPGHGAATKSHDPDDYRSVDDDILAALPDEPVDAIGYSMGARILLTLAASHPRRFHRLVLGGVGAGLLERDLERGRAIAAAVAGDQVDPEDHVARHFHDLAREPGNDPAALAAFLQRPVEPLTAEKLSAVSCPVLIVIGSDDFGGPGEPLADALGDATVLTLPGVDHHGLPKNFTFLDRSLEFLDARPF